jgi:hypothetical protein
MGSCDLGDGALITGNTALAAAAFLGMGLLCGFETLFLVWKTFRRRSGLYFWSLVIATISEIIVNASNILYFWVLQNECLSISWGFSIIATFCFVLFEYLVLYSRLDLVFTSQKRMRYLLGVIAAEIILVEFPLLVISFLSDASLSSTKYAMLYDRMWKIEAVTYMVVDCILSLTYIVQVKSIWNKESGPGVRSILRDIVAMTIFVIGIDILNVGLVFVSSMTNILYALEVFCSNFHIAVSRLTGQLQGLFIRIQDKTSIVVIEPLGRHVKDNT